jgi:hypothetical protein
MIMEPALADYLSDRPRQLRLAQQGIARSRRWQARDDVAAFQSLMRGYVQAPPADLAQFTADILPHVSNLGWLKSFVADGLAAIAEDPFAVLPWRMQSGAVINGLVLIEDERANAMLCVVDHLSIASPPDPRLTFDGGFCAIVILDAQNLVAERFSLTADGDRLAPPEMVHLADDDVLFIDASRQAVRLLSASRDVVLLRIAVTGGASAANGSGAANGVAGSGLIREFDARTGLCNRSGTGSAAASRILMLLDLVRGSGRADLPAMFAHFARHEDRMVRWQGMRDLLAVDLAAARPILRHMARSDPDMHVKTAAQATLAVLGQLDGTISGGSDGA